MRHYKCLQNQRFEYNEFALVPLRDEDILKIRTWRNEQMTVLRQNEYITEEMQLDYFENQVIPNFDAIQPKQVLFSYLKNNKLIGYGGLVHFSWLDKRAEVSFLLDNKLVNDSKIHDFYFENYLYLIQQIAFEDLKLNRLHTEVYDTRQHHVDILEKCGFVLEGKLRNHIYIGNRMVNSLLHGKLKSEYKS